MTSSFSVLWGGGSFSSSSSFFSGRVRRIFDGKVEGEDGNHLQGFPFKGRRGNLLEGGKWIDCFGLVYYLIEFNTTVFLQLSVVIFIN